MTAAKRFEKVFRFLVPAWLIEADGDSVLRSLTRALDEYLDRALQGLNARFPTRAASLDGMLEQVGADRGIVQGRSETQAHYANRLVAWRYPRGHRVRGSGYALLEQVSEYWGAIACKTIDRNGNRTERSDRGVESTAHGVTWTWDSTPASSWSRFWVLLDGATFAAAQPNVGDPALWGGSFGLGGYTIGQTGVTSSDVAAMRRLMTGRAWRPSGTQPEWVIVVLGGTFSTPVVPDATWVHWSKLVGGAQVSSRDARCRYWSLDPTYNNVYAGNPSNFASIAKEPSGSTYAGSPISFPSSATLWGGATYAGNPSNFASSIQLVDDGDPVP